MASGKSKKRTALVGAGFAVKTISVLLAATAAGWVLTEIFPSDFQANVDMYERSWGRTAVRISSGLKLYDPFHSFWYSAVFVLFFATLLVCTAERFKTSVVDSIAPRPPEDIDGNGREAATAPHGSEKQVFEAAALSLEKHGYRLVRSEREGTVLFTAVAGRWRGPGSFLFHAGLLVLAAGGMAGSLLGRHELLYGRRGDILPLHGKTSAVRIDDFTILRDDKGMIRDYISGVSALDAGGRVLKSARIEVNKPLRFEGFNIYQSSYYVDEEIVHADLRYLPVRGDPVRFRIHPGAGIRVEGTGFVAAAGRFFPDFRIGPDGPYSAGPQMMNPALGIRLVSAEDTLSGYLFMMHPKFNTVLTDAGSFVLDDVQPVYYTGLEFSSNPGAGAVLAGMFISTAGLLLIFPNRYRKVEGRMGNGCVVIGSVQGRRPDDIREEVSLLFREASAAFVKDGKR